MRRLADRLSQRAYTLEPARPLLFRVVVWMVVCALSALTGAAAIMAWHEPRTGAQVAGCTADPVDESQQAKELAHARLALAEESAARAAVQTVANRAADQVARLTDELQFLRGQSRSRPAMQPAVPRH
jgi:1-aminocyclopropane-1-carboxylate deaminase/D-cysteine desulfhydrase-like pyridoxal-dependent ACC family enzyme